MTQDHAWKDYQQSVSYNIYHWIVTVHIYKKLQKVVNKNTMWMHMTLTCYIYIYSYNDKTAS